MHAITLPRKAVEEAANALNGALKWMESADAHMALEEERPETDYVRFPTVRSALASLRAALAEPAQPDQAMEAANAAYDRIDRFLRNNLDDYDYGEYAEALELVYQAVPQASAASRSTVEAPSTPDAPASLAVVKEQSDTEIYATVEALGWLQYDIAATRDYEGQDWDIRVTHPDGGLLYNGPWHYSANKDAGEVIAEAVHGACLSDHQRFSQEIADLRNVVQAACIGGIPAMAKSWEKYFPDHPISIKAEHLTGVANGGWRPIGTRPMDGTRFLATTATGHIRLVRQDDPCDRLPIGDVPGGCWPDLPVAWMPLPPPPAIAAAPPTARQGEPK